MGTWQPGRDENARNAREPGKTGLGKVTTPAAVIISRERAAFARISAPFPAGMLWPVSRGVLQLSCQGRASKSAGDNTLFLLNKIGTALQRQRRKPPKVAVASHKAVKCDGSRRGKNAKKKLPLRLGTIPYRSRWNNPVERCSISG
jgi:hypothetical protein